MPKMEDAVAESVSNGTLCDNCCKVLQKPLVCSRCKAAAYCSKDCQVHTSHRTRGALE
jgi:predicted transcriptional regulator